MKRFHVMVTAQNIVEVEADNELDAAMVAEDDRWKSVWYEVQDVTVMCEVDELGHPIQRLGVNL